MEKSNFIRCIVELSLIFALGWFSYSSLDKLLQEDTIISNQYSDEGIEFPSVTICVKWLSEKAANSTSRVEGRHLSLPNSDNWTFTNFMEKSFWARNMIKIARFKDQFDDKETM